MAHSPRARSCFKRGGSGKTNKTNKWRQSVKHLGLCPGTPMEKGEGQGEKTLISLDRRSTRRTHWEKGTQKEQDRASEETEEKLCYYTTGKWTDHKRASHWIRSRGKPKSAGPGMGTHGYLSCTFCTQTRAAELNPRVTAKFLRIFCVCTFPLFC